jgi:histidinol dehydrogenase
MLAVPANIARNRIVYPPDKECKSSYIILLIYGVTKILKVGGIQAIGE